MYQCLFASTCVVNIYAPKHIMSSLLHALSLETHTLAFMREIYLHSCKGIYTAPLLARALVYGVEKHLVINM